MSSAAQRMREPACQDVSARPPQANWESDALKTPSFNSQQFRGLRQPRVLREIGLSLFEKGVLALTALVGHVKEPRGIPGELLDPRESIRVRVERSFQEPDRRWTVGQDFAGPRYRFLLKAIDRDDGVDEAHSQRFLRVVLTAQVPDLLGLFLANGPCQEPRPIARVKTTDAWTSLAEASVLGRNRQVADQMEHVTPADRIPGDGGDHRFGNVANEVLQIEHIQARYSVLADVAGFAADLLVASGAECLCTGPGQNDHADVEIFAGVREGVDHLGDGQRSKCIAHLRSIDRHPRDAVIALFEDDVLVTSDPLPIHVHLTLSWLSLVPGGSGSVRNSRTSARNSTGRSR